MGTKATEILKTGNQLHTDFDTSKTFIGNNRFEQYDFENTTGGLLSLEEGQLLGRVTGTENLEILKSGAADGSEIPLGIMAGNVDFAIGETKEVSICIEGEVAEEQLILDGGDTLDTVIDGRLLRDRINADTAGIKLTASDALTGVDNA